MCVCVRVRARVLSCESSRTSDNVWQGLCLSTKTYMCSFFCFEPLRIDSPHLAVAMYHVWPVTPGEVEEGTASLFQRAPFGLVAGEQIGVREQPPATESIWELRRMKRHRAVDAIKRTAEYTRAANLTNLLPNATMPPEPDPNSRCSKRQWERSVMDWKSALRATSDE